MRTLPLLPAALAILLTGACTQAHSDEQPLTAASSEVPVKKNKDKGSAEQQMPDPEVPGLRRVGSLKGVPESSGLAPGPQPGTYYSFGDNGNAATLYQINGTGDVTKEINIDAKNKDWESLTRNPQGIYFIGDCGNNASDRRDLRILRVDPSKPDRVDKINFTYPEQTEFPPKKKQRDYDCEATLWHDGKIWLFTKDQQEETSHVYTLPDQPGTYQAQRITSLAIPGQVTDATLSPNGHRLVLLARSALFILDGNTWADILKATPRQVDLPKTGQTEGVAFKDENTLLIGTEQGDLFEFKLP